MKTIVLSLSFFVLTVSPYTCTSEMMEENKEKINQNALENSHHFQSAEIDPIVMPKKP
ncbi:hypothetical protein [Flavobacterium sp. GCM10023249]|uniref:hypothetical protein n=1 Tax=unclassified Flavobacterium TaxID=196869 RepID=UPI00360D758D